MIINAGYGADISNMKVSKDTPYKIFSQFSVGMLDQFRASYDKNIRDDLVGDLLTPDEYVEMFCLYDYTNDEGEKGLRALLVDIINYNEFKGRKVFKLGKCKTRSYIYVPSYTPLDSSETKKMLTIHKISKIIHKYEKITGIYNIVCDDIIIDLEELLK